MNIFVGNLSKEVTEDELVRLFSEFGHVRNVKIVRNMTTNESKGYGFVDMPGTAEAQNAIGFLNTKEIKGKRLTVNQAHSQKFDTRIPGNNFRDRSSRTGRKF